MSQHARRVLAALGLMAALLLAAPPPSRAAGLRELPSVTGFVARSWAWLEKQVSAAKAAGTLASPTPPPPAGTSEEGSAIDPNGRK